MPTIAAGSSPLVSIPKGSTLKLTGNGYATLGVGRLANQTINITNSASIGPYDADQNVELTAMTDISYMLQANQTGLPAARIATDVYGNKSVVDPTGTPISSSASSGAFETLVGAETYTVPLEDYGSAITIAGTTFNKVNPGKADPNLFVYNLAQPSIFSSGVMGAGASNASASEVALGSIKLPGNCLLRAKDTLVTVTVVADSPIPDMSLNLAFSRTRTNISYRAVKRYTAAAANTITWEVVLNPIASSAFKITNRNSATASTTTPGVAGIVDVNLLNAIELLFSHSFAAAVVPATCNILSITAQVKVGVAITPTSITQNYRLPFQQPFAADDIFNTPLTSTAVCRLLVSTASPTASGDGTTGTVNATGTGGTNTLTVGDASKVIIGMVPTTNYYIPTTGDYGYGGVGAGAEQDNGIFPPNTYVTAVDTVNNIVTLNNNLLKSISFRGTIYYGTHQIAFGLPETINMGIGVSGAVGARHPITGITHADYRVAYTFSWLPIVQAAGTDPIKKWTPGYVVGYNGWPHALPASYSSNGGETFNNPPAYMSTSQSSAIANTTNISFYNGDRNVCMVTPDGTMVMEHFLTSVGGDGTYTSTRSTAHNLYGYSIPNFLSRAEIIDSGHSQGNRAYGGAVMSGIIRSWEVANLPAKPTAAITKQQALAILAPCKTAINHKLAIVAASRQLRTNQYYDGTNTLTYLSYRSQYDIHRPAITTAGTGYAPDDVLYITGGSGPSPMRVTVLTVNAVGGVTDIFVSNVGQYLVGGAPNAAALASASSGSGTGCVLNALLTADTTITTTALAFPSAGLASIYAYPATNADGDWASTYEGNLPMGSIFAIPKTIDLDAWFTYLMISRPTHQAGMISPIFFAVCYAAQKYGCVVVDRAGNTLNCLMFDSDFSYTQMNESSSYGLTFLATNLCVVENVAPAGITPRGTPLAAGVGPLQPIMAI